VASSRTSLYPHTDPLCDPLPQKLLDLYPEVRKKMQTVYEQRVHLYNKRHPITYKHKYLFLAHDDEGEVRPLDIFD
jgi:hypothetical protein